MHLKPKNQKFIDRLRKQDYTVVIESYRVKAKSYREEVFGEPPTWSPVYYWMVIRDEGDREIFLSRLFGDVNEMIKYVRKDWNWNPRKDWLT